jgi:hypothetical protein
MLGAPAAGTRAVKVTMLHANFEPKQLCRGVGWGVVGCQWFRMRAGAELT